MEDSTHTEAAAAMVARLQGIAQLERALAGSSLNRPSLLGEEARQVLIPLLEGLCFPWTGSGKPFKTSLVTPSLKYIRVCLDEWDQGTERGDRLLAQLLGTATPLHRHHPMRKPKPGSECATPRFSNQYLQHRPPEVSPAPAISGKQQTH